MAKDLNTLTFITVAVLVLLLSIFNLQSIHRQETLQVLGQQTENYSQFWQNLVDKHPTYKMGWYELGRIDKVLTIDPNFNLDIKN